MKLINYIIIILHFWRINKLSFKELVGARGFIIFRKCGFKTYALHLLSPFRQQLGSVSP